MSFELEKEIFEQEGIRVAFCNPARVKPTRSYKEAYPIQLSEECILDDAAARIAAFVGEGHPFVIVFGDGAVVKYRNIKNTVVPLRS